MSYTWSAYFEETRPKDYRLLGFYEYRLQQSDFTFSFRKESDKLKKDLSILITNGPDKMKEGASLLNESLRQSFFLSSFLHGWLAEGEASTAMVGTCLLPTLRSDCPLWKKENPHNYGGHLLAVHLMVCLPVVLASSHASSCAYLYDTNFM